MKSMLHGLLMVLALVGRQRGARECPIWSALPDLAANALLPANALFSALRGTDGRKLGVRPRSTTVYHHR
jgi:hypothetical protein